MARRRFVDLLALSRPFRYSSGVRRLSTLHAALAALLFLAFTPSAVARSEVEVSYTREQTFSAALRYLRVDLAYEVTEKDPQAAYLLFSFAAPELSQKVSHGSIEMIQRERTVRVLVNLPELPSYQEEVLKHGLLDKLKAEYGEPPAAPPPRKSDKGAPKKPNGEPKEPGSDAPAPKDPSE